MTERKDTQIRDPNVRLKPKAEPGWYHLCWAAERIWLIGPYESRTVAMADWRVQQRKTVANRNKTSADAGDRNRSIAADRIRLAPHSGPRAFQGAPDSTSDRAKAPAVSSRPSRATGGAGGGAKPKSTKPAWYLLCWTEKRAWLKGPYESHGAATRDWERNWGVVYLTDPTRPLQIVAPSQPAAKDPPHPFTTERE